MGRRPLVPVIHAATRERPDEVDTILAAEAVAASLGRLGYRSEILALVGEDLRPLARLRRRHPLVVFNLVEALSTDMRKAWFAPARLEALGLGYTGSSARALLATVSKLDCKETLAGAGLPTPDWSDRGDGLPADGRWLVKSVDEHASIGIDARSIVTGAEVEAEIARREAEFGGRFFAEAYVDGREFNISLLEGRAGLEVLPIPEIDFVDFEAGKPRIVDYEAKWIEASHAFHHTPRRFGLESREPELAAELARICRGVWEAFGISGYARVDFRVDGAGRPYVIDINTNPGIAPDAGLAAAADEVGIGYDGLIGRIVEAAVSRLPAVGVRAGAPMPEPTPLPSSGWQPEPVDRPALR